MKLRAWLTFGPEHVQKPMIWKLIKTFDALVVNIRTAEIKEDKALVALELEADEETLEKAIAWLQDQGVHVEPIEQSVIAG